MLIGEVARLKGDAAIAARSVDGPDRAGRGQVGFAGAEVIIDALFGAGLDRPVEEPARSLIEGLNARAAPIVAVDLPSGINGTSGAVMGSAIKATQTVTFFRKKPGHLLLPGRLHCGTIGVADIGIPDSVLGAIAAKTFENTPELWRAHFPHPRKVGHKYDRGHVVVASGPDWSTGAARLAARGAIRAGAGLVTIASPREALAVNAAASQAVMVRPVDGAERTGQVSCRPPSECIRDRSRSLGVGEATAEMVLAALSGERAVVLDADAITSFAGYPAASRRIVGLRRSKPTILTPHEGEFSRYFGALDEKTKIGSKLDRARLSRRVDRRGYRLKGADTVVASADGRAAIAANAPPYLATAGAGDVLTGMTAALLAQGMPAFEAAAAAVWLHGEAANAFGPG